MATVADYQGRTCDLLAFTGIMPADYGHEQLLVQQLVGSNDGGALIAGIEKLAQRFLLTLLLRKGSRVLAPDDGTIFMIDAARGHWRTVADVQQSFYVARLDAGRQLVAVETDADPDDERYASADLTGVVLNNDRVTIRLILTSRAANHYTFLTPLHVSLRG